MNTHIKNLADQALASTQWSVVNDLSTVVVDRDTELEKFTELLLADCLQTFDMSIDEQNRRFLPILQTFARSFKETVKKRYSL